MFLTGQSLFSSREKALLKASLVKCAPGRMADTRGGVRMPFMEREKLVSSDISLETSWKSGRKVKA